MVKILWSYAVSIITGLEVPSLLLTSLQFDGSVAKPRSLQDLVRSKYQVTYATPKQLWRAHYRNLRMFKAGYRQQRYAEFEGLTIR